MKKTFGCLGLLFGFWIFMFLCRSGVSSTDTVVGTSAAFIVTALCLAVIVPVVLAIGAGGSNTADALKRAGKWMRGK